jgi:IclR family pca regulon transcriptional regulator
LSNKSSDQSLSGDFVQSLERGLRVLRAFSAEHSSLTLTQAAQLTGLTRATVRRSLHTFAKLGYVALDGKQFQLTPQVLDLGYAYLSSAQIGDIAQPYMEALSEQINESVSVAVLDSFEIVYVARIPTKRIMRIGLALGSRLPALATSMGRMIVADLPSDKRKEFVRSAPLRRLTTTTITKRSELVNVLDKIHKQGWALLDQELEEGVRSIAAPIRDKRGRTIAAINIGTQTGRVSMKQLTDEFIPLLLKTAADISITMGRR